jgi:hypothetical protein
MQCFRRERGDGDAQFTRLVFSWLGRNAVAAQYYTALL